MSTDLIFTLHLHRLVSRAAISGFAEDLCQKLRIYASRGSRSLIFRLYRFRWAAEDFIAQSLQKLLFVTVEICRNIDFISYILYFHEYVFEFQT